MSNNPTEKKLFKLIEALYQKKMDMNMLACILEMQCSMMHKYQQDRYQYLDPSRHLSIMFYQCTDKGKPRSFILHKDWEN